MFLDVFPNNNEMNARIWLYLWSEMFRRVALKKPPPTDVCPCNRDDLTALCICWGEARCPSTRSDLPCSVSIALNSTVKLSSVKDSPEYCVWGAGTATSATTISTATASPTRFLSGCLCLAERPISFSVCCAAWGRHWATVRAAEVSEWFVYKCSSFRPNSCSRNPQKHYKNPVSQVLQHVICQRSLISNVFVNELLQEQVCVQSIVV